MSFFRSRPNTAPSSRRELLLALSLYVVLNLVTGVLFWTNDAGGKGIGLTDFPLDDAWIHMVYARSIGETLRPEYNPGQLESGMTSPFWVLLNGLLFRPGAALGLDPTVVPKLLSLGFGIAAAFLVHLVTRRLGGPLLAALGAGVLLSIEPRWCFARASGMEVTLVGALLVAAVWALCDRRNALVGLFCGLALLTRPESALFCALALPVAGIELVREGRWPRWRSWPAMLLPVALALALWGGYNLSVTGYPLPNTFYVKAHTGSLLRPDNLGFVVGRMLLDATFFRSLLGMVLLAIGAWMLIRRRTAAGMLVATFPWIFIYGVSVTHTLLQARPFFWGRYLYPVYPFLVIAMMVGLAGVARFAGRVGPRSGPGNAGERTRAPGSPVGTPLGAITAGILFLAVTIPAVIAFPAEARLFSRNCANVRTGNVQVGRWLERHTSPGEWVATMDAGAIRYFSDRPVLDLIGLNDHTLAHTTDATALAARIAEVRPGYYALFPAVFAPMIDRLRLESVLEIPNHPYTICDCPSQSMVGIYRAPPDTR